MKCKNCGNELPDDAKFCQNCGTPSVENHKSIVSKNIQPGKSPWHHNFKWWHILIVSLVSLWISGALDSFIFSLIGDIGLIFSIFLGVKEFRNKANKKAAK